MTEKKWNNIYLFSLFNTSFIINSKKLIYFESEIIFLVVFKNSY